VAEQLITCREVSDADADALRELMRAQMRIDPGWPPGYAKSLDLAAWLGQPATLGRWAAVDEDGRIVGHGGLGRVESGPASQLLCAALDCPGARLAEICRLVVDPAARGRGVAGLLTRKAMRTAIDEGRIPVATVLDNRGTWLQMMLDTGWREVGWLPARSGEGKLALLLPAERLVTLARRMNGRLAPGSGAGEPFEQRA